MSLLPNPESLYFRLRDQIDKAFPKRAELGLIGVHSAGAWIAQRLHADLGLHLPCGFLDSAFYRDDFSERGLKDVPKPAQVPFDVQGRAILLVDDVLYTGRTTRAIVNHLFDFGRPAKIELAVLLDRGGRELPIEAQYVGEYFPLKTDECFVLTQDDQGTFQLSLEVKPN